MSTTYYELKAPWSHIRWEDAESHVYLTLWQDGGRAGYLTVEAAAARTAVLSFAGEEVCVKSAYAGGTQLHIEREPKSDTIIDEYGRIESFRDLSMLHPSSGQI